jgi:uncharacterized protein (UPF0332 family)
VALAEDLLAQARVLANIDATPPRQASLRRAVSTAYYALFHLLVAACVQRFSPIMPIALGPRIGRALAHGEMKEVCLAVTRSNLGTIFTALVPGGFSLGLRKMAETFVVLQDDRHIADYDLTAAYTRAEVLEVILRTEQAFADWKTTQPTAEAGVFLSALLFARRWSK